MGAGAVAAIIIGLVVLAIFGQQFLGQAVDTTNSALEFYKLLTDANKVKITPNEGERLCDISITVYGELTETLPLTPLFVRIGDKTNHPEGKSYTWFDCHDAKKVPALSLFDIGLEDPVVQQSPDLTKLKEQAIFLTQTKIHVQIVLKSGPYKIDAVTQPSLKKEIIIPAGDVPLPIDVRALFVISNIPERDYTLEVYYGREINNMDAGQPWITKICRVGLTTC